MSRSNPLSSRVGWVAGIAVLALILITAFSEWIVEWLWLDALGYESVFLTIKLTQIVLLIAAFGLSMLYMIPNMRTLARGLTDYQLGPSPLEQLNLNNLEPAKVRFFFITIGVAISVLFALAFYIQWDSYFRFHWSETVGTTDPIFGRDIGFYLFRLPFIEIIQNSFTVLVFFITVGMGFIYVVTGALGMKGSGRFYVRQSVVRHLSFNAGLWLILLAIGFFLERYQLLLGQGGTVNGAGYVDVNIRLTVLWLLSILCLLLGGWAFYAGYKNQTKWLLRGALGVLVIMIIGQGAVPTLVQQFNVEPNELEYETPYIEHDIQLTREAYKLNNVTEREYEAQDTLSWANLADNQSTLDNIRLWDPRMIIQTYRQLQEIRLYYQFYDVDVDRYRTEEGYQQMMIAARELAGELPEQADNWVNRRLQYTHGYGLVMSPVAQEGATGDPDLVVKDLPPVSEIAGLEIDNPAIYYGEYDPDFRIVSTGIDEFDYPAGDENIYTSYEGDGGVPIGNLFSKLLFAWHFRDINILLTDYIEEDSKIQFWKSIQDRIRRVAPFLEYEDDPYLVLDEGKLYWIQEAYTTSEHFPYSEPYQNEFNYIRNSVKVVVDAYEGNVDFYAIDEEDPVLKVYRDIFPDMFKPLTEMPGSLTEHLRYPQFLFEVQMEKYNNYHMTRPQVFYNQEDLWTRPNEKYGGSQVLMESYYVLSKLPGEDDLQYMLISPLTPNNRDNMIAWMAAKSDFPGYGELVVYKLPKDRLIYGPAQVEARIDQDTEISRQLSLWDQRGSQVIRGNLMVIPIEDSFLYVEPVFLIADDVDIPQLQRVIVSVGEKVVMEPTLEQALQSLFGMRPEPSVLPVAGTPSPATIDQISEGANTADMEEFRALWREAQEALQDGNWQTFGEKMEEIEELVDE